MPARTAGLCTRRLRRGRREGLGPGSRRLGSCCDAALAAAAGTALARHRGLVPDADRRQTQARESRQQQQCGAGPRRSHQLSTESWRCLPTSPLRTGPLPSSPAARPGRHPRGTQAWVGCTSPPRPPSVLPCRAAGTLPDERGPEPRGLERSCLTNSVPHFEPGCVPS